MASSASGGVPTARRRSWRASLLVACVVVPLMGLLLASCDWYGSLYETYGGYAQPYGRSGDRITSGQYDPLSQNEVYGHDHAACADALDTSGNLVTYWACGLPGSWTYVDFDESRMLQGIIRNNTTGDGNHITGKQWWTPACFVIHCGP
jgi:hypothetical protein